jgi:CPA1 family monovalent cation:H+ antiporter
MFGWAGAVVGVVIVVRLLWLLPMTWVTRRMHLRRDVDEDIPVSWRETVVMWWAGMRGVASVALALAIPLTMDDGSPFPERDEIVFLAFGVIMATLVLQGLSLPWLVRKLGVRSDDTAEREFERQLALRAAKAAKRRLKEIEEVEELPEEVQEQMVRRAYDIGLRINPEIGADERREKQTKRVARIKRIRRIQAEMMSAARHEVLAARSEPGSDPEVVDRVLRKLDVRSLR